MPLLLATLYLIFLFIRPQNVLKILWGMPVVDWLGISAIAMLAHACMRGSIRRMGRQPQVILCLLSAGTIFAGYLVETHAARLIGSFNLLVLTFLPFTLVSYAATSRRQVDILMVVTLLSLIPIAISCWMMHYTGVGLAGYRPVLEVHGGQIVTRVKGWGIFAGPNETATIMAMGVVLAFSYAVRFLRRKPFLSVLVLPLIPLYAAAFWWTNSRQAIIFMGAGVYGLFARLKTGRQLFAFIAASVFLLAAIGASARWAGGVGDRASRRRAAAITQGLRVFKQHPILGVGRGRAADYLGLKMPAHNSYLEVLVDTGFFGFAAYLGVGAVSIVQLLVLTRFKGETAEEREDLAQGRQLMALAMLVMTSAFFQNRAFSPDYFVAFGLCSGYGYYMCSKYGRMMPGLFHMEWHKKWGIVWLPVVGFFGVLGLHVAAKLYWANLI